MADNNILVGDDAITATFVSGDANDDIVVLAARTSTNRGLIDPVSDAKLIEFLVKNHHTSPLEMVSATYLIDCPIFVARQIHRHRTGMYNELSRRYTSEAVQIWVPGTLRRQTQVGNLQGSSGEVDNSSALNAQILLSAKSSLKLYADLIDQGVAREQARIVLPQSTMTRFYMKMNLHNWLKFIRLRTAPDAQHEVRVIADAVLVDLETRYPRVVNAWKKHIQSAVCLTGGQVVLVQRLVSEEDSEPPELTPGQLTRFKQKLSRCLE